MASASKGLAAKVDVEEVLPSFDDVFDNESWEARLERARAKRDAAIAEREIADAKTAPEKPAAPNAPNGTAEGATASVLSLNEVLKTGNLKDRLELAQQRHAQINENTEGRSNLPGFSFSKKSTAEFKKVVLYAKAGATKRNAADDSKKAVVTLEPANQVAEQSQHAPGNSRRKTVFALLAVTLMLGVVGVGVLSQRNPALLAGVVPKFLLPATPIEEFRLPEGTGQGVEGLAMPTLGTPSAPGVPGNAAIETMRSQEPVLALESSPRDNPLTTVPGLQNSPDMAQRRQLSEYQPTDLNSPAATAVAINRPQTLALSGSHQIGVVPKQPDFLGGVGNSVQLSALIVPYMVPPLVASNSGMTSLWNMPVGQGATVWNASLPSVFPKVVRYQGASALPEPIAPHVTVSAVATPVPIALQSRVPEMLNEPGGISTVSLEPMPRHPQSTGLKTAVAAQPFQPAPPAGIPAIGQAPEPNLMALLAPHKIKVFAPINVSDDFASEVATKIGTAGFEMDAVIKVAFTISTDNIRFYHEQDAATAQALAELTNANARDFTSFSPRPAVGTVEFWLAGTSPKPRLPRLRRAPVRNTNSDAALQALRDRLVQRMQRGDHLGGG